MSTQLLETCRGFR